MSPVPKLPSLSLQGPRRIQSAFIHAVDCNADCPGIWGVQLCWLDRPINSVQLLPTRGAQPPGPCSILKLVIFSLPLRQLLVSHHP